MQVVRRYRVKVYSIGVDRFGDPYGDSYTRESVTTDKIGETTDSLIGAVVGAGERVHSVHVEPIAEFLP